MSKALRPYIGEGDYVKAEERIGNTYVPTEGIVVRDSEGTLRVGGEDGANVNGTWVNIISWRENV